MMGDEVCENSEVLSNKFGEMVIAMNRWIENLRITKNSILFLLVKNIEKLLCMVQAIFRKTYRENYKRLILL